MESPKDNKFNIFTEPFSGVESLSDIGGNSDKRQGYCALFGLLSTARAQFLYALTKNIKKTLVVMCDEQSASRLADEYKFYEKNSIFFPAKDILFYQSDLRSNELTIERIKAIQLTLLDEKATIFTTIEALMNKLSTKVQIEKDGFKLVIGDVIDLDIIRKKLVETGYEYSSGVSGPGEFSVRGGIIDIFPLSSSLPYRIELWGDEIDSIRCFDPSSQRSIENVDTIFVSPAREMPEPEDFSSSNESESLIDYFSQDSMIILETPWRLEMLGKSCEEEFFDSMRKRLEAGMIKEEQMALLFPVKEIFKKLLKYQGVVFCVPGQKNQGVPIKREITIETRAVISFQNSIPLLKKEIGNYKKKKYKIVLIGTSKTRQKRLCDGLMEDGLNCFYSENYDQHLEPGQILVTTGRMDRGVEFPDSGFVFVTDNDIFGEEIKRQRRKTYHKGESIAAFRDLNVGDYVIHENYGLGIYQGMEKIEQDHVIKDYIKITYAKGANLYVQATQLDLISKYSNSGDRKPKLNSLGNLEWGRTKERVRKAVGVVAKDLVELYALRQQDRGYKYGEDTTWQQEFEETFPYEETEGQTLAIKEVKDDLMSNRIMDRLICGDVGFGKTEIALRAAFKVVQENKQVVYLCPTTILAQQHYNTFVSRMKNYPVNIGLMSRFRTTAQNKETVQKLKSGEMDIVIGTHRALSKDVSFHDLGLLVIDEEQRFGVTHKEKIKQIKKTVDVLSLTATPIPRTLHMSLIGIRDMSLLEEAPLERQPVQTFVFEYNEEMVREAIERELARGGQVYYVINRVKMIPEIAARVQNLVPEASVVYAHGKMPEQKLEDIMEDFIERRIDVLVATTIIEIGLDISNVNTIIIHDADQLGLSQLYQLRGRVGRSSRRAYAFLMYRRDKILKEVAVKRLTAINEFTELGSGFKIAMRDLEIRGAGNLLGEEQHGHMEAVGYDLYCKLLSSAIKTTKGDIEDEPDFETSVEIDIDAFLPSEYITDEEQKLEIYKRISRINNESGQEEMVDELIDRFGEPPRVVMNLIAVARLRHLAHGVYLSKIKQMGKEIKYSIMPQAKINPVEIPEFIGKYRGKVQFVADKNEPTFLFFSREVLKGEALIREITEFIKEMEDSLLEKVACDKQNDYNK